MRLAPCCLPLAFLALPARAGTVVDPFTEPDEADAFQVEEQLVTVASRYAQTVEQAPSIVTVVTDREIRERGFRTLADLLASIPGVYTPMAPEGRSLAWFRGVVSADNNKILLLVDGVPWYDGVYTHAWLDEYVPLENVRQVEIIKGPGSAIYGTNAFAGVVNVVTYGPGELKGGFIRGGAGSHAWRSGSLVLADAARLPGGRTVGVSGMARFLDTDGDGLDLTPRGTHNVTGTQPRRAVNAGLHVTTGGLSVGLDVVDYRHTYYTQPQDDALDVLLQSVDEYNLAYRDEFFSARYRWEPRRDLAVTPYVYYQHHDDPGAYAWFSDPEIVEGEDGSLSAEWRATLVETEKETERLGLGAEVQARPAASHHLVGGLGWEGTNVIALEDRIYTDLAGEPVPDFRIDPAADPVLSNIFAYAQDTFALRYWLELTAGVRLDLHSVSGFSLSPRLGLLLVPTTRTTAKVLYGRAFRAPNPRELLVLVEQDDDGTNRWTAGNPDLEPEKIQTLEGEILYRPLRQLDLRGAVFASVVRDEIDKRNAEDLPHPDLGDAYYDNFKGASAVGAEAEVTGRTGPVELAGSVSLTRATDRTTERPQYEFPPFMAHGRCTFRVSDAVRASVLVDHVGTRPREEWSPDAGLDDGDPFTLVHAAVATDLLQGGRVRADVSIRNVFDTEYATLIYRDDANAVRDGEARYPEDLQGAGRSVVVGIEAGF